MPRYIYTCADCGETLEQYHPITVTLTDCPLCKKCNSLSRVYETALKDKIVVPKKVGDEVKKFIKDAKEDLAKYHGELKK